MLAVTIDSFSYSEKQVLKKVSFQLNKGEHLSVLGESGCGKSTLLHLIYGTLQLTEGTISWDKKPLLGPSHNLIPGESFIKLVAQEYELMPFTTVAENIAENLSRQNSKKDADRVSELLNVVALSDFKNTKVKFLSGGQKQRVALAKALAKAPELLLLDEPFSSIDTFQKNHLQRTLFLYLKKNNIACITATHDSEEALSFSDKLILLKDGEIDACGTPEEIYKDLSTVYRAGFFGEVNVLPKTAFFSESSSEELILLPHQLTVSDTETKLQVTVKKSYFKGYYYLIQAEWKNKDLFFLHSEIIPEGNKPYLILNK